MPKNIVVFSDGTGQDGGVRPEQRISNVYKLYRACRTGPENAIDPAAQVAFYDPGLGTDIGATAMSAPVRFVQKLLASVEGRGITANIADCYEFIVNHYRPGDRIFLIGFSRGAYTVRCVASLLMLCGVPTRTPAGPLPLFRKATRDIAEEAVFTVLEHGAGHPRAEFETERNEQARRFRARYGSDHESGETGRSNVAPHFVGVFDTVAALGATGLRRTIILGGLGLALCAAVTIAAAVPAAILAAFAHLAGLPFWWSVVGIVLAVDLVGLAIAIHRWTASIKKTIRDFPNKGDVRTHRAEWKGANFDRLLSRFVPYARSANAIDETRKDFARVPWGGVEPGTIDRADGPERLVQTWFAGNHSDIGGSYPETESRLSDITLGWMVEEATRIPDGLIVDGLRAPGGATGNPKLHLFPGSDGVQHCEVAGMRDAIESKVPKRLLKFAGSLGWPVQVRPVAHDAPVHPTVSERFSLPSVAQCAGSGPYRPAALAGHDLFKHLYPPLDAASPSPDSPPRA
jgi:uncharacterized protein (DUF2235 family)